METRKAIEGGWRSVANILAKDGHHNLAADVKRFVERMPAARTEREWIAQELQQRIRDPRVRDPDHIR